MPSRTLNRLVWPALLVLILILGFKTRDTFEVLFEGIGKLDVRPPAADGTVYLRWRGKIDAPMESRIADAFARYRAESRTIVLSLSSSGGSLDHGAMVMRLLQKIRETHKVETVVEAGSRCASMCVPVYLQGQRRTAAASARFMFHEVSFREVLASEDLAVPATATAKATDRFFNTYFKPAGVPEAWIRQVRTDMTGGNDIWKTARELVDDDAGIVQQVF